MHYAYKWTIKIIIKICFKSSRLHSASSHQGYGECDGQVWWHSEKPGGAAGPAEVWWGWSGCLLGGVPVHAYAQTIWPHFWEKVQVWPHQWKVGNFIKWILNYKTNNTLHMHGLFSPYFCWCFALVITFYQDYNSSICMFSSCFIYFCAINIFATWRPYRGPAWSHLVSVGGKYGSW